MWIKTIIFYPFRLIKSWTAGDKLLVFFQPIIEKDFIEIEDLISSKYIIFYEIISPF